ncbi:enoyl-CoA hydratase [Alicycliphilus sp. B1]|nr:enoyl-CoA hydratase [Alicycliphilus sp. B1]
MVLSGAGSHFCAGGDIEWMKETLAASQMLKRERAQAVSDMLGSVHALPQPLVAEVRGLPWVAALAWCAVLISSLQTVERSLP